MMRKTLAVLYLVFWLSVITGTGYYSYQGIKTHAIAWEDSHPEYCTNQYDYRCGQKNPWGAVIMIWIIGFPIGIVFCSAWANPRVERHIGKWFPKT